MYLTCLVMLQSGSVDYGVGQGYPNSAQFLAQIVFYIIAFVFVVILAFYSTKWIASAKILKQSGGNVRLVERVSVSQQGSVLLLKVGGKYVLIGVTKEHVSFLTEVNEEDIVMKEADVFAPTVPFIDVFNQLLGKKENKDEE